MQEREKEREDTQTACKNGKETERERNDKEMNTCVHARVREREREREREEGRGNQHRVKCISRHAHAREYPTVVNRVSLLRAFHISTRDSVAIGKLSSTTRTSCVWELDRAALVCNTRQKIWCRKERMKDIFYNLLTSIRLLIFFYRHIVLRIIVWHIIFRIFSIY